MGKPIATVAGGICFAFPDVCKTPSAPPPGSFVPVPYPNTGQLSAAQAVTTTVKAAGNVIVTSNSSIPTTTGDEAGSLGGTTSSQVAGRVSFLTYSMTVKAEGANVVRMFDTTSQNAGNATGQVLGGVATILVGD